MERGGRAFEEFEKLQAEIQREKAESLGRAGERLDEALRKLGELRVSIKALREELTGATLDRDALTRTVTLLVQNYNILRQKAALYHRYLIIQREAVGFTDHQDIDRLYRLPDPLDDVAEQG
jgi:seryl-tRNA(Sec) selenium transferase